MTKGEKKKLGRPSELAECLVKAKEYLLTKYSQASQKAKRQKIELENESLELQGQINELLKDNKCANELVPNDVANKLCERVNQIRQTTTNPSKSIK